MKPLAKRLISHALSQVGLAGLADPNALLSQVALGITNHAKFSAVLLKCEPEERANCYLALKNRLSFEPKPLEIYVMEGKQEAERLKLPVFDSATGTVRDYDAVEPLNINAMAEKAIARRDAEETAKGSLELVCRRCTFAENFPAKRRSEGLRAAEIKGWRPDGITDKALCPKCAPKNVN